jgi:hypothetical protein
MVSRSSTDSSSTVIIEISAVCAGAMFIIIPHRGLTQTQIMLRTALFQHVDCDSEKLIMHL